MIIVFLRFDPLFAVAVGKRILWELGSAPRIKEGVASALRLSTAWWNSATIKKQVNNKISAHHGAIEDTLLSKGGEAVCKA